MDKDQDNSSVEEAEIGAEDEIKDEDSSDGEEEEEADDCVADGDEDTVEEDDNDGQAATSASGQDRVGLLDRPLVIEGKRQKRTVDRLEAAAQDKSAAPLLVEQGKGTPLGDIEAVNENVSRVNSEDLRILHRLLFGVNGKKLEIKKHIRLFSGFPFGAKDERLEAKRSFLSKYQGPIAKEICEYLCLVQSGTKAATIDRCLEFLLKPSESALTAPGKAVTSRRKSASGKGSGDDTVKSPKKAAASSKSPKKSPAKAARTSKTPTKATKATRTPTKSPAAPRKRKSTTPKQVATALDSDSSDEEPLSKKVKTPFPTDEELEESIKDILKKSDLDSVSVKAVLGQLFERYGSHDLTAKKDELKSLIKEIYTNMA